ncbi:MAG: phenylalanine--tRNA ligase subunit beta [Betaproteobacteria bacterium]|nr:phenylalanine--tRNA ligase subunit beta [Betaproteobacteria bacterium]
MKVSVNWLKELVKVDLTTEAIAHALTMAGLEVEEVHPVAAKFAKIVVAEVKSTAQHPNADKLRVCDVDAGTGATLQIVCGAPNVAPGLKVPCALVGASLPMADGKSLDIKAAKLRGVDSNGMLCSARELGMSDDHGGLLVLAADAPVGANIREYLDLDDVILTLKMTPNRGDCLSMVGVARDLAAVTGAELNVPAIAPVPATIDDSRPIHLTESKACGQYCGRVIRGIDAKAKSPDWMIRRLERAGFRSISPLVDITNYLTLERGRPLHAFDLDKLKGGIDVRFAKAGEELDLLIDEHVILSPDTLLICDDSGPVALGGVMGGKSTMVTDSTGNVFFEAAFFEPGVVQGKTREFGLNSDAAHRFERGVDFTSARAGVELATRLTLEICGGQAGPITEATGTLPERKPVRVRAARAEQLIGMPVGVDEMQRIFARLQCKVESGQGGELMVAPPAWRFDLNIEEDFIEEVARIRGYEQVPAVAPLSSVPMLPVAEALISRSTLKRRVAAMGYQEVVTYSFIPEDWEADFAGNRQPVRVANPIASHLAVMRTQLLGGLIDTLKTNLNRGEMRLQVFEIGRCFLADEASFEAQPERVAGLAYGPRYPEQWGEDKAERVDFFALKGDVETLLAGRSPRFEPVAHPALHPGRAASIWLDDKQVGVLGELHPRWQQKHDLPNAPVYFELVMMSLLAASTPRYKPLSRMQATRRDVAVVVDDKVSAAAMKAAVEPVLGPQVADFELFDLYRGSNLDFGKKSVAFRVLMQDTDRTLTDDEAETVIRTIVEVLSSKFGATLR